MANSVGELSFLVFGDRKGTIPKIAMLILKIINSEKGQISF